MWVTTMRGIPRRGRGGVRFTQDGRTELFVVSNDPEQRGEVPPTATPVTVDQAEAIIHDSLPGGALNVSTRPATDAEAADLRSQLADRDSQIAEQQKEIERLKREARQTAPADPAGGPSRLRAARNVKPPDPDGFGGGNG